MSGGSSKRRSRTALKVASRFRRSPRGGATHSATSAIRSSGAHSDCSRLAASVALFVRCSCADRRRCASSRRAPGPRAARAQQPLRRTHGPRNGCGWPRARGGRRTEAKQGLEHTWIRDTLDPWSKRVNRGVPADVGYHRRSVAETTVFRAKTVSEEHVSARTFAGEATGGFLRCAALNRMADLGMAEVYSVAA